MVKVDELRFWIIDNAPLTTKTFGPKQLARLRENYPDLHGREHSGIQFKTDRHGRDVVDLTFKRSGSSVEVGPPGREYRNGRVLLPTVGGTPATLHPLMLWWGILHALSMLTRYEPDTWAELIDVDRSPDAIHIEALIEYALDSVPDLICRTLYSALAQLRKVGP